MSTRSEWAAKPVVETEVNGEVIGTWWCGAHNRCATHVDEKGNRHCDPRLGGIMIPCMAELVPALIEIEGE